MSSGEAFEVQFHPEEDDGLLYPDEERSSADTYSTRDHDMRRSRLKFLLIGLGIVAILSAIIIGSVLGSNANRSRGTTSALEGGGASGRDPFVTSSPVSAAPITASPTPNTIPSARFKTALASGASMSQGDKVNSPNGRFILELGTSGDLTISNADQVLWIVYGMNATNLTMQENGNLELVQADGTVSWETNTTTDTSATSSSSGNSTGNATRSRRAAATTGAATLRFDDLGRLIVAVGDDPPLWVGGVNPTTSPTPAPTMSLAPTSNSSIAPTAIYLNSTNTTIIDTNSTITNSTNTTIIDTNTTTIDTNSTNTTTISPVTISPITASPVTASPITSSPVTFSPVTFSPIAPMETKSPVSSPTDVTGIPCGEGQIGNGFCEPPNCCSKWGWCGITPLHCTDGTASAAPIASLAPITMTQTAAPVVPPTSSPVVPPTRRPRTSAPVDPQTDSPVVPPTSSPVVPPTRRPRTSAPVDPPTDSPVVPPTSSPVVPPTRRPRTIAPVDPPTEPPVVPPTLAPVPPPVTPPVVPPTSAPVVEPSPVSSPVTSSSSAATVVLSSGARVFADNPVASPNGQYFVGLNGEGWLVVYNLGGNIIWTANGKGATSMIMNTDGQLWLQNGSTVTWRTNTFISGGATLRLDNNGRLFIAVGNNDPVWVAGG